MLSVLIPAAFVVIIDPPQPHPGCAPWVAKLSDGSKIRAKTIDAAFAPLGAIVVPAAGGSFYCSGFEGEDDVNRKDAIPAFDAPIVPRPARG